MRWGKTLATGKKLADISKRGVVREKKDPERARPMMWAVGGRKDSGKETS